MYRGKVVLKFSRLIYCGPGVFILQVEKVEKKIHHLRPTYFGFCKDVVYLMYGWFWNNLTRSKLAVYWL